MTKKVKENIGKDQIRQKGWKRVRRILFRSALFLISVLFLLSISFIVLSQTYFFRNWFYGIVLDLVNNELSGRLEADDIKISPFEGITITNLKVIAAGDTVAAIKTVNIRYSFSPILSNYLYVKSVDIDNARIKLIRSSKDSSWNFEHIAKPSDDNTPSKKLDWIFDIVNLNISNADVSINDKTTLKNDGQFDILHSHLKNFNLSVRTKADFRKDNIFAGIKKLRFDEQNSGIKVNNLTLQANITKKYIELGKLNISTNYFKGEIYAVAETVNIFDGLDDDEIDNAEISLDLRVKQLNLALLRKFETSLPLLQETIDIEAELQASKRNISARHIAIKRGESYLHASGKAGNILDTNKLNYNLEISNSNLFDSDLRKIKEAFNLSFTQLDRLYIRDIKASGNLKTSEIELDVETAFGKISGRTEISLDKNPGYNATLNFRNINIGRILDDASLTSDINGDAEISGSGLTPETINSIVRANLNNSHFYNYSIKNLNLDAALLPNQRINIDTLNLALNNTFHDSTNLGLGNVSSISANGFLDFKNERIPTYDLDISLNEFNFASLLRTNLAPQYLDTKLKLTGSGFHPDSIQAKLSSEINACVFGNRALMPFNIDLTIERFGKTGRLLLMNSELFNLQLVGEYRIEDFVQIAETQVTELVTFINRKVFNFYYDNPDEVDLNFRHQPRNRMNPYTMDLTGEIKDLTPIGIAVGQPHLSGKAKIDMYVDVEPYRSIMDLRKLDISNFQYKDSLVDIALNPMEISGKVDMRLIDSMPVFEMIGLSVNGVTESYIDDLSFDKPRLSFFYTNDSMNLSVSTNLNNSLLVDARGRLLFTNTEYKLNLDSVQFGLNHNFRWNSSIPLDMALDRNGLKINQFNFHRNSAEKITLKGNINPSGTNDLILDITDFPVKETAYFVHDDQKPFIQNSKGKIESLRIILNDSLNNPNITASLKTDGIYFYNRYVGEVSGKAVYQNRNISGGINIIDSVSKRKLVSADINSIPINISLSEDKDSDTKEKKIDLSILAYNAPLVLVNPFLPEVISNMSGTADGRLDIRGTKDDLDYIGYINAKSCNFLANVNNMYFTAKGGLTIQNENIIFDSIEVFNDKNDLANGKAKVDGSLIFRNFNIERFNLSVTTNGIKLLANKSAKSMPDLYGDFIIASGNNPVVFRGTFTEPYLEGDVNILKAKINMPIIESLNQIPKSRFTYEIKGKNIKVKDYFSDSLLSNLLFKTADTLEIYNKKPVEETPDFSQLLNYNLTVTLVNPMEINMEMPIGEVFAVVTTKIPGTPFLYYVNPKKNIQRISEQLELKSQSTFKYIKLFNVTGAIRFTSGDMENPELELKAEYNGKSQMSGNIRNYQVNMFIRGTKNNPLVSIDYNIDDETAKGDSAKIREDALFLMLFGVTKSEFENPTSSGKSSPIDDLGAASLAAVLSKSVTDMLSGTGFITSADIDLQGGSFQNAKLKLSGQIFGMVWNVGGTIADVMNGYEFTAEIPVGLLLFPETLKSMFLLFTTSVNPTTHVSRNQKNWEVKLKFGGVF